MNIDLRLGYLHHLFAGLVLVLLTAGCQGRTVARSTKDFAPGTGFVRHEFTLDGEQCEFWVFVPKDYRPGTKYPAILFLHGLFEASRGGDKCLSAGLGPVIASQPDKWRFITIFPQSDGTWQGEERDRLAMAALDAAEKKYSIDTDRIVLAGLSYGGLGTWEIGARHRERFAALVPVSGFRAADSVERISSLPVWAFAFSGDFWVSPRCSQEMCQQIKARGGRARLTEFAGIGHDGWDRAVRESDVVNWMLQQRRQPILTDSRASGTSVAKVQ